MTPDDFLATPSPSRRQFMARLGAGAGMAAAAVSVARLFERGAFAEALTRPVQTPPLTEGPYYPDHLPLDTDNDLLIVSDATTPAVGEVTQLSGLILDANGDPVRNATIEIWQVDHFGSYIHSNGLNHQSNKRDTHFQGYGRFETASTGEYRFRTIKPVAYPGRTPHIHVKVSVKGREELTTQIFVKGEKQNRNDGVLREVWNPKARQNLITDFAPIPDSKAGELVARFDIVLGYTPAA